MILINASVRSADPMAALRLNTSLYLAAAKQSFNPKAIGSLAKGFGLGMAGAAVDAGLDGYEDNLYDDTLDYFTRVLEKENAKLKGINIVSKN